ncbi:MAG: hypothetical protein JW807_08245 [Spirochaetes bacterium]|nr:hypothetical protein [Spirochaetota bacterium]
MIIHNDFHDIILSLQKQRVEFVIAGAFALALYGHPRATGDIDIWVKPDRDNAGRLLAAIRDFGFTSLDIIEDDILSGKVIQLGYPPVRIDFITRLTGLTSEEIWNGRTPGPFGDLTVDYIGRESFIKNKKAIGRNKDLADIDALTN